MSRPALSRVIRVAAARTAVLGAGTVLAAASAQAQQRVSLGTGDVAVYDLAGTVRVVATSGTEAFAEIVREGADASKLSVESGDLDGRRSLRVIFPGDRIAYSDASHGRSSTRLRVKSDGTFGDANGGGGFFSGREVRISSDGGLDARANITLNVPAGRRVAVYVGVGSATVSNVNGQITVHAYAADVTTSGTRGSLNLDTGSGKTEVTDAQGNLDLDTGSGDVTLRGLKGERLNVDAGSGRMKGDAVDVADVRLDLGSGGAELGNVRASSLRIDSGSGSVNIDLRTDVQSLRIDSGSGSVTLRVPPSLGARLEIDAGSGGYEIELPVTFTRRSRSHLSGSVGDGQGSIDIDSGSGSVRILKGA